MKNVKIKYRKLLKNIFDIVFKFFIIDKTNDLKEKMFMGNKTWEDFVLEDKIIYPCNNGEQVLGVASSTTGIAGSNTIATLLDGTVIVDLKSATIASQSDSVSRLERAEIEIKDLRERVKFLEKALMRLVDIEGEI